MLQIQCSYFMFSKIKHIEQNCLNLKSYYRSSVSCFFVSSSSFARLFSSRAFAFWPSRSCRSLSSLSARRSGFLSSRVLFSRFRISFAFFSTFSVFTYNMWHFNYRVKSFLRCKDHIVVLQFSAMQQFTLWHYGEDASLYHCLHQLTLHPFIKGWPGWVDLVAGW